MANLFTAFTSAGMITSVFELEEGASPTSDQYPTGGGYISDAYDPDLWYIVDPLGTPTPTERPVLVTDDRYTILADNTDAVSISVPSGTLITDLETGSTQTAAGADTLQFKSNGRSGQWFIQLDAPSPYQAVTIEVIAHADDN